MSNSECNRCKRTSGTHEQCSVYSATPVCDIDSKVPGIQDTGDRKLAECVQCKKDGMLKSSQYGNLKFEARSCRNKLDDW